MYVFLEIIFLPFLRLQVQINTTFNLLLLRKYIYISPDASSPDLYKAYIL